MRSKYNTWIQVGLLLLGLMGSVYVACTPANSMMRWYNVDDAFYYYKVAQNVLAGHGFSFDQITFTNGFHPLWMIICLGVFWFSKINILFPLRLLIIVSGIFNALTGVLLFRLLKKSLSTMSAIIGASAWVLVPSIFKITIVHGMESSISAFFIVLLILFAVNYETQLGYKLAKIHHLLLAGLIGALTILARLDNVFVVGILGLFMILRIKSIPKIVIFDAILIAIASFMAWILRLGIQSVDVNRFSIYPMALTAVITMPTIFFFTGVYKTENHNLLRKWMRITFAIGLSFIIEYGLLSILFKLGVLKLFSKSVLAIGTILTFVLIVILHSIFSRQAELISRSPFHVFSDWFKKTWKDIFASGGLYAAPITGIIGAYMVGNKLLFGTFTPVSGQIKQWWSTLPNTIYS